MVGTGDVGKKVLSLRWDVDPGSHKLYVNITDYAGGRNGRWDIRIVVQTSGGQTLVNVGLTVSRPRDCPTTEGIGGEVILFDVPYEPVSGSGTGDTSGTGETSQTITRPNWEDAVNRMMNMFTQMMGMVVAVQIVVGVVSGTVGSIS